MKARTTFLRIIFLLLFLHSSDLSIAQSHIIKILGCSNCEAYREQIKYHLAEYEFKSPVIIMLSFQKFTSQNGVHDLLGTTIPQDYQGGKMFHVMIKENISHAKKQEIIAHEMVHVKQFYDDRLIDHNHFHLIWEGLGFEDVRRVAYRQRPWEREALEQTPKMLFDFKLSQEREVEARKPKESPVLISDVSAKPRL